MVVWTPALMTNLFAVFTALIAAGTVLIIMVLEILAAARSQRSWFFAFLLIAELVLARFAAQYIVVLFTSPHVTDPIFRPMQCVMMALFTGTVVNVYRLRDCQDTLYAVRKELAQGARARIDTDDLPAVQEAERIHDSS